MKNYKIAGLLISIFFIVSCENKTSEQQKSETIAVTDTVKTINHAHNYASNKYSAVDVSPMDMIYYPVEYYKMNVANQITTPLMIRIIYSRPHLNGRVLFKDVLKYDEPWRLGANEATEIQFFREVTIQDKKIKPGRYILYSIPNEKNWVIVLNSNIDTWGLRQDTSKDLFRFNATATIVDHHTEYFTMIFDESKRGADLVMAWDNFEIRLPIDFSIN